MAYSSTSVVVLDLVSVIRNSTGDPVPEIITVLHPHMKSDLTESQSDMLKKCVLNLKANYTTKIRKCSNNYGRFLAKHENWLNSLFQLPTSLLAKSSSSATSSRPETSSSGKAGRPEKLYSEASARSKHAKVAKIAQQNIKQSPTAVVLAASKLAKSYKRNALSAILKKTIASPNRASTIQGLIKRRVKLEPVKYTADEALALLLDLGLSKRCYETLRLGAKSRGADIYPSYNKVRDSKKACRPSVRINLTESSASVPLQHLLDHTFSRIIGLQDEVIKQQFSVQGQSPIRATLICSWGFDGSTGQSNYKQKYKESEWKDDSSLFATTVIPLRLVSGNTVIWNNKVPQSVRSCRPLKLSYTKESKDLILQEKQSVEEEIKNLHDFSIRITDELQVIVRYQLHLTIIDGKVLSIILGATSYQNCPLCDATPSTFNNLNNIVTGTFKLKEGALAHGISPLHAWIRCLEHCFHLSYRLPVKKWRIMKGSPEQLIMQQTKKRVQDELKSQMGLLVDIPKSGGSGNSNDGNTARRAFRDYTTFASILGLDVEYVKGLRTILIALSCQLALNPNEFGTFCKRVAQRYVGNYNWYPMPSTIHKILIHGEAIISESALPVGVLGEEAGESRNKIYKSDRLYHSRKCDRKDTMEDVFNRAMDSSDPVMSNHNMSSRNNERHKMALPPEVRPLLQEPALSSPELIPSSPEPAEHAENDFELFESFSYIDNAVLVDEILPQDDLT